MPFVPPPAREAPYKALPPHIFPTRTKLFACLLSYLQVQLWGLFMAPFTIGAMYLINHDRYIHSAQYRHFIWFMAIFLVIGCGVVGLAMALRRFVVIQIGERGNRPPA